MSIFSGIANKIKSFDLSDFHLPNLGVGAPKSVPMDGGPEIPEPLPSKTPTPTPTPTPEPTITANPNPSIGPQFQGATGLQSNNWRLGTGIQTDAGIAGGSQPGTFGGNLANNAGVSGRGSGALTSPSWSYGGASGGYSAGARGGTTGSSISGITSDKGFK
jgi:hypothetical protein